MREDDKYLGPDEPRYNDGPPLAERRLPGGRRNLHGYESRDEYTQEQLEFLRAVIAWKSAHGPFIDDVTAFRILKAMGYRKVEKKRRKRKCGSS